MILILKQGTSRDKVEELRIWIESAYGVTATPIFGSDTTIVGLIGDTSGIELPALEMQDSVERVMKVSEPFKRANRKFHPDDTVIRLGGIDIGSKKICVAAGPCSVEGEEQVRGIARSVSAAGAVMLRGGAFKPRSSPYSFQGLRVEGLMYMKKAREATGLPIVSEMTNPSQIERSEERRVG